MITKPKIKSEFEKNLESDYRKAFDDAKRSKMSVLLIDDIEQLVGKEIDKNKS